MSALRPPSDFACRFCDAESGATCVTASGVVRSMHHTRFDDYRSFARSGTWVVRLLADDPRFGLNAGDELLVQKYPWDAKVTVLRRVSDGFDPECNQYLSAVEYVRVAEHELVNA